MTDLKSGYKAPPAPGPSEFSTTSIAILATRWNVEIVDALVAGARRCLRDWGLDPNKIEEHRVPGAYELPLGAAYLFDSRKFSGVVALGAVIRGETPHFEYVAGECARGLMHVQIGRILGNGTSACFPVGFGVLTVNTVEQALARTGAGNDNKGYEAAAAVLEMIRLGRTFIR